MKKILLTGATGFIGSHLLEALLKSDYKIIVLKRSTSNTWRINHLLHKVQIYNSDDCSYDEIFSINSIDTIIHLATLYRKHDDGKDADEMIQTNVTFPINLLETGLRYGIKAFFNTGTFFEYDCSKLPIDEQAKIRPFNLYAKTKIAFEKMLSSYSERLVIKTFRLFSPYGEKDNNKLIPLIIQKALQGEELNLSDGLQKLDFIYVKDIVDAYISAIKSMDKKNELNGYKVYNLGSGVGVSVREIVSIVEQQLSISINKVWGEVSTVDTPVVIANISQASSDLSWHPKHSIHQGITKTISYYKTECNED